SIFHRPDNSLMSLYRFPLMKKMHHLFLRSHTSFGAWQTCHLLSRIHLLKYRFVLFLPTFLFHPQTFPFFVLPLAAENPDISLLSEIHSMSRLLHCTYQRTS